MKKLWLTIAGVAVVGSSLFLAGCNTGENPGDVNVNLNSQTQGVWVNGEGKVTVTPDLALITLGIEAQAISVADAQSMAAEAMDKVVQALKDQGVEEKDIQTQYFNISQVSRWDNDKMTETVTGYRVTNTVVVKVRDVSKAGATIDAVVAAGGDLTRVNNISFTVDDPTPYYNDARKLAVDAAEKKAQQMAAESGITLGKVTYITESNYYQPIYRSFDTAEGMAVPAATVATSISGGELEITTTVNIAYEIK